MNTKRKINRRKSALAGLFGGIAALLATLTFQCAHVPTAPPESRPAAHTLQPPTIGLYEGAFPDLPDEAVSEWKSKITEYETTIGKKIAWTTLMNDFTDGFKFPEEGVRQAQAAGTIPYIRILPRSKRVQGEGPEPIYQLEKFMKGEFDTQIREWCRAAARVKTPLLTEFGQEANGDWYGWGGFWNGADLHTYNSAVPDGPYHYREAIRRYVKLCREEHANNLTWFFHLDSQPKPQKPWNRMAFYYPGDEYIDWVGLSVFGAQYPTDYWGSFAETLDPAYEELSAVTRTKPMAILEMGVIEKPGDPNAKARWLKDALSALRSGKYPRVKAVNYWNEASWLSDHANDFRVNSSPAALTSFISEIQSPEFLTNLIFN